MSKLGKRQLHELYYYMKLTRRLEDEIARLHREHKMEGPVFLGAGQEAVSIGAAYCLEREDAVASSLPSVGHLLVRGLQPTEILAHVLGKDLGPTKGREGAIYLGDWYRGIVSPAGHMAAHIGVLAGVALAAKFQGRPLIAAALADGKAAATGDFHEALNFAAVHRLALIVVLDHQPRSESDDLPLLESSRGYGVPSLPVDGVDVLQVLQVVETAVERARSGKGPTLVEVRSARGAGSALPGDGVAFPFAGGRSGAPTGDFRDPVETFESFLVDHTLLQPVERGLIVDRIERIVANGLQVAEENPFPDVATAASRVFGSMGKELSGGGAKV